MTIEDLERHGVLLPEAEWGEHELETTVPEWPLAAAILLAAAALVVAFLGDGQMMTWVGTGSFLVLFFVITWVCDRAILRQRRRFRREREEM